MENKIYIGEFVAVVKIKTGKMVTSGRVIEIIDDKIALLSDDGILKYHGFEGSHHGVEITEWYLECGGESHWRGEGFIIGGAVSE